MYLQVIKFLGYMNARRSQFFNMVFQKQCNKYPHFESGSLIFRYVKHIFLFKLDTFMLITPHAHFI